MEPCSVGKLVKQPLLISVIVLTLTLASSEIWRKKVPQTEAGRGGMSE
jgi:hypothetical protein